MMSGLEGWEILAQAKPKDFFLKKNTLHSRKKIGKCYNKIYVVIFFLLTIETETGICC